jgi:hypothetical protein
VGRHSHTPLTACGTTDNPDNPAVAPPGGAFSNSNLNGTYVVSFSGYDLTNGYESYFAVVGTLTANGGGSFTTGLLDIQDPALGNAVQTGYVQYRIPTSGNYNVTSDGRGSGTITVSINGEPVQFGLDFVLTSSAHGLISRFDANGTGSGTIDLQSATIAQSALEGSYAFGLSGVDSTTVNPLNTVGAFTLDANGNITAGVQDFTNNGNATNLQALALQGTILTGSPGPAQMITSAAGLGTLQFDAWVIDPTHIKLIETDGTAYLEGDAFISTGNIAFPSGPLVFTLTGADAYQGPFSAGGLLTSDGNGLITDGLEDINDQGIVSEALSLQGSFTSNGARSVLTLNGLYNGGVTTDSNITGNYAFAAYPYNGGVMLLEIDNGAGSTSGISGGNLYVQSATTLSSSAGYGLNLSGANTLGEVDLIAQFTTNANTASGLYDVDNFGWLLTDADLGIDGSWPKESNSRGFLEFPYLQTSYNSEIASLNLTYYVVDPSSAIFIETDPDQTATGVFLLQNASDLSTPARSRFVPLAPASSAPSLTR